jgi:translation initiation factor 2-alpha kinase 4
MIWQGGFGKVVKALNKLDRNFYAIKKVKLSSDPAVEQKVLREVTTWSRLSHPAIVRYHTAWVESQAESMDGDAVRQSFDPSYPETAAKSTSEEDSADDLASAIEADFDLGMELEDADFLSVNPHISASSSYPRIHFGNDSDDSSLPSRNPSRRSPFVSTPTGSPPPPPQRQQQRTLYIQMEYISGRTLREAIDDGFSHEEAWRVLSQILSAMVYYSALSITHRDLKPQNCFIDAEGHVKVGDFGLAVETKAALDEAQHQNRPSHLAAELSDLTSGVGTSLYMSPEMVSQRGNQEMPLRERAYASRIDMYSLGIRRRVSLQSTGAEICTVFFEMVHCMHTKMERLVTIKNLRLPQIQMPIDFQGTQSQRQLIRSLLVHDPQERPSPQEVLQSGILPAPLVDETVAEVSRLISSGKSPHRSTVLKALFSMATREAQISDLLFDHGVPTEIDVNAQVAKAKLVCIFESRGAVELALDGPIPLTSLYELGEGRRPVKLLKQDGNVLMLPYDHTVPLCRRAARDDALSRLKRCTILVADSERAYSLGRHCGASLPSTRSRSWCRSSSCPAYVN